MQDVSCSNILEKADKCIHDFNVKDDLVNETLHACKIKSRRFSELSTSGLEAYFLIKSTHSEALNMFNDNYYKLDSHAP